MNLDQSEILRLVHLLLIAFFVGGQFSYLAIIQPASFRAFGTNEQIHFLQNILKRQNPILLFCLCLVVLSGGFMITPIKSALGADYFSAFSSKLISKLAWFFVVFFITAYQTLGVGFKIRYLDPAAGSEKLRSKLNSVRWQMTITSILNIIFVSYVVLIARGL